MYARKYASYFTIIHIGPWYQGPTTVITLEFITDTYVNHYDMSKMKKTARLPSQNVTST